jgi:hypothetical protein
VACAIGKPTPDIPFITDPTIIPPGPEEWKDMYYEACGTPFEEFVSWTKIKCKNFSGRMKNQDALAYARDVLVASRLFQPKEFNGVKVRWCQLNGAHGMAPGPNEVYVDTSAFPDIPTVAALLGHEMQHIRQWRRHGASFKCKYSEAFVTCGCQDSKNRFEAEAYATQNRVWQALNRLARTCEVSFGTCPLPWPQYVAQVCWCGAEMGRAIE